MNNPERTFDQSSIDDATDIIQTLLQSYCKGDKLTNQLSDLSRFQSLVDTIDLNDIQLRAFSIVFGQLFVQCNPEYEWFIVSNNNECPAVGLKSSNVLWYPTVTIPSGLSRAYSCRTMYRNILYHIRDLNNKTHFTTKE